MVKNDIKYIIKRVIVGVLISIILMYIGSFKVNASTVGPSNNILEFQWLNGQTQNASATQLTRFNQIFYYHNSGSSSNYRGLFAFTNNNIYGNYFSFSMYVKGSDMYVDGVNARIQFSDGSWWSCPINSTALTDHQYLYNATCEINNGMNLSVYKYGFNFNTSVDATFPYYNIAISQLSYFSNVSDFNNAINNQNTIIQNASEQAHQDAQQINDSITNSNIDNNMGDDFTSNDAFSDNNGLESIINLPLNMINSLTNTCTPIVVNIPKLNVDATIPCMSSIYRTHFNELYQVVKLIINGFFIYRILLKIYQIVHDAKQPDLNKIEVIEL